MEEESDERVKKKNDNNNTDTPLSLRRFSTIVISCGSGGVSVAICTIRIGARDATNIAVRHQTVKIIIEFSWRASLFEMVDQRHSLPASCGWPGPGLGWYGMAGHGMAGHVKACHGMLWRLTGRESIPSGDLKDKNEEGEGVTDCKKDCPRQ